MGSSSGVIKEMQSGWSCNQSKAHSLNQQQLLASSLLSNLYQKVYDKIKILMQYI